MEDHITLIHIVKNLILSSIYDISIAKTPNMNPLSANQYSGQNHPGRKHDRPETTRIPFHVSSCLFWNNKYRFLYLKFLYDHLYIQVEFLDQFDTLIWKEHK